MMKSFLSCAVLVWVHLAATSSAVLRAQDLNPILESVSWRSLGPYAMSGRVVAFAVHPADPSTCYVAAASGGLWKTTNRGSTWAPVFDEQSALSMGDVAIAPSDPEVLYVGTGEANNQRSSYWGDGVYRSTDAGKTWEHLGLEESHHIGRIAVDPENPDRLFVAALGHLYTPNAERGLYRSLDGGKGFELVKFVDPDTGFVDVVMDRKNPRVLVAASYERRRRAWNFQEGGPGSGIWRTEDGGDTWERIREGLPEGLIGRIGLAMSATDSNIVYAIVENLNLTSDTPPEADPSDEDGRDPDYGGHRMGDGEIEAETPGSVPPPAAPRPIGGEVYRSDDGGKTWKKVSTRPVGGDPHYYYGQIRIDPNDADRVWVLGVQVSYSEDGGKTWKRDGARGVHVDHHALWIDPNDSEHMLLGNDGGLCRSYDGGKTWDVYENLPLAQYYAVGLDRRTPYRIYGGLQDNGSWGIPSVGRYRRGIGDAEAFRINGGDGFYCVVDPEDDNVLYSESQFGNPSRFDLSTLERTSIKPRKRRGGPALRFNWMAPIAVSPHNPRTIYMGSQMVHRSFDRGNTWEEISPDLSTNDAHKIAGNVPHCTITTIAESPERAGVIWAGTDDGRVWVSQDAGRHWRDLTDLFPSEVRGLWVSRVEPSHHDKGVCYVSFTGYREDRFEAHLFVTDDFGGTWESRSAGLPASPVNVVLEDPANPNLLYVGLERGVWTTVDGGETWHPLDSGIPAVPVHDLALHEGVHELVAGTHGRGIYVADVLALRTFDAQARGRALHVGPVVIRRPAAGGPVPDEGITRAAYGTQPTLGAQVTVWFKEKPESASVEIQDVLGNQVAELRLRSPKAGVNRTRWDLTQSGRGGPAVAETRQQPDPESPETESGDPADPEPVEPGERRRPGGAGRGPGGGRGRRAADPGDYVLVVKADGKELKTPFRLDAGALLPSLLGIEEVSDDEENEALRGRDF